MKYFDKVYGEFEIEDPVLIDLINSLSLQRLKKIDQQGYRRKNFPLKETSLPDLCADRIDYSLRDALNLEEATSEKIKYLLENLIVKNRQWVFKNAESAKQFAMNGESLVVNDPQNYQSHFFCKSRVVNPLFEESGEAKKLSDSWPEWKEICLEESKPKEYFVRLVNSRIYFPTSQASAWLGVK